MGDVIVVTLFTKRFPAAPEETIGTNRSPTVGAVRHGAFAARRHVPTAERHVFDLAARHFDPLPHKLSRNNASLGPVQRAVLARRVRDDLPSGNSGDF
jgi:hypothetical protein